MCRSPSMVYGSGLILCSCLIVFAGCSGPRPVLYPNEHLQQVGQAQAEQDIAECEALADQYVKSNKAGNIAGGTAVGAGAGAATGAVSGAIRGSAGTGAAIGAATGATVGLLHGLFSASKPSATYMNFVNRCLGKKGYEATGWD